jgi:hypothetical protein
MRKLFEVVCFTFAFAVAAHAADCNDGITANAEGDYKKALAVLQPLAAGTDDCAQFHLGLMYLLGEGVKQDKVMAREFFEKSAAKGNRAAKVQLDKLSKK